jgi:hypothetical protein
LKDDVVVPADNYDFDDLTLGRCHQLFEMNRGVNASKTASEYQDRPFHCPDRSLFDIDSYKSTAKIPAIAAGFRQNAGISQHAERKEKPAEDFSPAGFRLLQINWSTCCIRRGKLPS